MTTNWDEEIEKAAEKIESAVAMIRKDGTASKPYCVYSKDGSRKFGCYSTRKAAVRRVGQIERFSKSRRDNGR